MNSGMNLRCQNCGQPATDSDVVCFHCGQPLPGREELPEATVKVKEGWQQTISPTAAAAYIGVAALVLLAFLLVTRALGQRPLVQVGFATRPAAGWRQMVNQGEDFLIYLPVNWQSFDGLDPEQADELALRLAESDLYQLATQPLSSLIDDLEIIYLSQNGRPAEDDQFAFLVIGRSALLSSLSYGEIIDIWSSDPNLDGAANFIDDYDKSRAEAVVRLPVEQSESAIVGEAIRCRQHFARGGGESYLLALCSPVDRYISRASTFEEINNSFQRLKK